MRALLNLLPFAIVALFAGLMLGAFPSVKDQLRGERVTPLRAVLFAAGFALPIAVSVLSILASPGSASLEDLQVWHTIVFILIGYAVAVTQLVPGLSATALFMTIGYFSPLMASVSLSYWRTAPQIFLIYLCLIVGFVAGLLTVSKLFSRLLVRWRANTFYTAAGLSLGSIVTMFFSSEILDVYRGWKNPSAMGRDLAIGAVLFLLGIASAYWLVHFERKQKE